MVDRAQSQVGFAGAESVFHLRQLDVPVPQLPGILFPAVGSQQVGALRAPGPFKPALVLFDPQSRRPPGFEQDFHAEHLFGRGVSPEPLADAPLDRCGPGFLPAHAAHLPPSGLAPGLLPAALGAAGRRSERPPAVRLARLGQDADQMARRRRHPRGFCRRDPAGRLAHRAQCTLRTEPLQDVAVHRSDGNPVNLFRAAGAMACRTLSSRPRGKADVGNGSGAECHASGPPLSFPARAGAATAGGTASPARSGDGFILGCGGRGRAPPRRSRPPERFSFPSVPCGRSRKLRPPRGTPGLCPDHFFNNHLPRRRRSGPHCSM